MQLLYCLQRCVVHLGLEESDSDRGLELPDLQGCPTFTRVLRSFEIPVRTRSLATRLMNAFFIVTDLYAEIYHLRKNLLSSSLSV